MQCGLDWRDAVEHNVRMIVLIRFSVALSVAALLAAVSILCAGPDASNAASSIVEFTVNSPRTEQARIPLIETVWTGSGKDARAIVPGTEEYYNLRVRGLCHVADGRLVHSVTVDGRVEQVLRGGDGQAMRGKYLLIRELRIAEENSGEGRIKGFIPGDEVIVGIKSDGNFAAGSLVRIQAAQLDRWYEVTPEVGARRMLRAYAEMASPSFVEYKALVAASTSAPPENVTVTGVADAPPRSEPSASDAAVSAERMPQAGPRAPDVRQPPPVQQQRTAIAAPRTVTEMSVQELNKFMRDVQARKEYLERRLSDSRGNVDKINRARASAGGDTAKYDDAIQRVTSDSNNTQAQIMKIEQDYEEARQELQKRATDAQIKLDAGVSQ